MSVAFYMDVHIRRAVVIALRSRSVDVRTVQEDGAAELDDDRLLQRRQSSVACCSRKTTICYVKASDFCETAATSQESSMRINCGSRSGQMVDDLELIAKVTSREDWWGKIEYLPLG